MSVRSFSAKSLEGPPDGDSNTPDLNARYFGDIWGIWRLFFGAFSGPPNTAKYYLAPRPFSPSHLAEELEGVTRERFNLKLSNVQL